MYALNKIAFVRRCVKKYLMVTMSVKQHSTTNTFPKKWKNNNKKKASQFGFAKALGDSHEIK